MPQAVSGTACTPLYPTLCRFKWEVERSEETLANDPSASVSADRCQLMRYCMRLAVASSFSTSTGTSVRVLAEPELRDLYTCLVHILRHPAAYGGDLVGTAANTMTDLIHEDPLCFRLMLECNLPQVLKPAREKQERSCTLCFVPDTCSTCVLCVRCMGADRRARVGVRLMSLSSRLRRRSWKACRVSRCPPPRRTPWSAFPRLSMPSASIWRGSSWHARPTPWRPSSASSPAPGTSSRSR